MNMLAVLTGPENTELYVRLARTARRYDRLTALLVGTPTFQPYMEAWKEAGQLLHDLNEVRPEGAPWASPELYAEPGDGEAERIAEVFDEARAEQDRGL